MQYFILYSIKLYWKLIPERKRKRCIFKKSCSHYVFETTQKKGFIKGLKAFYFRYQNCRGGFEIFENPSNNKTQMLLPSRMVIDREEIVERLLIK
jgi:uncharacterized protein